VCPLPLSRRGARHLAPGRDEPRLTRVRGVSARVTRCPRPLRILRISPGVGCGCAPGEPLRRGRRGARCARGASDAQGATRRAARLRQRVRCQAHGAGLGRKVRDGTSDGRRARVLRRRATPVGRGRNCCRLLQGEQPSDCFRRSRGACTAAACCAGFPRSRVREGESEGKRQSERARARARGRGQQQRKRHEPHSGYRRSWRGCAGCSSRGRG